MSAEFDPVLIVGAGPVGLTLAWRLSEAGVPVQVFEAEAAIADQLRASTFHPPTLDLFDPSGITEELINKGRITPTWQIRMLHSTERAEFDLSVLAGDTGHPYRLQCRQAELSRALLRRLPDGVVRFSSPVIDVDQDGDGVSVRVGRETIQGSYLVGCDGSRSIVRRAIGAEWEGGAYPENTVLVTTHFPFEQHLGNLSGVNYIWKPGGTFSLLRLPDVWRVSLHPQDGQSPEEALEDAAIRAQIAEILPHARDFDIIEKRIYKIHRRVASSYGEGRMFLAGDAAHLNSPKGGMGMNGGIHDAWLLADLLAQVASGTPSIILEAYERKRRPIAKDDIVGQADENRARMNAKDMRARQAHLAELQRIAGDPERARAFLLRSSMIEGLRRAEGL
ncbi:FAD-dependent oxidoreductase [Aestuariivita boseongensis]|uniref:FAD-dependent oxidoreductase n=1 Tax=Aestuariivita boseongensis TaxID=1470562 RepID=UPI00068206AB|nr:FAD-dependent monooxygenase [Aestuariivita boseongensis]